MVDPRAATFNLKAVVQETGLKPDTLRAWERRYGLPQPERTEGGHRLYSQRDIDTLKWLVTRQSEGMSISRAVELWAQLEAQGEDPLANVVSANGVIGRTDNAALANLCQRWTDACLAFDEPAANQVVSEALSLYPVEAVAIELLQAGVAAMGRGWYEGRYSVQQEHFASALAMRRLETLMAAAPRPNRWGRILVACPPEEEHVFSPLLISLLLRRQGWDVTYLGARVPLQRFRATVDKIRPQLVVLVAQQLRTAVGLRDMAAMLNTANINVAFGGLVFNRIPQLVDCIPAHFLGGVVHDVPAQVEKLMSTALPAPERQCGERELAQVYDRFVTSRSAIEAEVWQALRRFEGMDYAQINLANENIGHNIAAALSLGSIDALGGDLDWIADLLTNHELSQDMLVGYLQVYRDASVKVMGDTGRPFVNWLDNFVAGRQYGEWPA